MAKKYHKLSDTLKRLLFSRNMKAVDLSREVNLPQPTVHRLVAGKSTRPYRSSLEPIADFFSISVEQLLGEEPLPEEQKKTSPHAASSVIPVPVISWSDLDNFEKSLANATQKVAVTYPVSDQTFSLVMSDCSMEPLFSRGAILIFDPAVKAVDRSYVLVKRSSSNTYVFRQLLVDADQQYIKSLNEDLSPFRVQLLLADDEVVACLVEARKNFMPAISSQP